MPILTSTVLAIAILAPAGGELPDVAIVAASTNTADAQNDPRFTDPRNKLVATGLFGSVTIINATGLGDGVGTPPLEDLLEFDAIITWSNVSYDDAVSLGDVLADYVDAGGGVVVAVFANTSTNPARYLQGRWLTDPGYIAIPQNGGFVDGIPGELGTIVGGDHPIFDGVDTFATGLGMFMGGGFFGGYRPADMTLTPGSTLVATWDTDHTLVAIAPNQHVVELGFHPVSNAVNDGYWDQTTDGGRLMANALLFSAGLLDGDDCAGDATGDGVVDIADLNAVLGSFNNVVEPGTMGDVTGDGVVDIADLNLVLAEFGAVCV